MTAVEWLIEQIEQYTLTFGPIPSYKLNHLKQQAKKMEKEQIMEGYISGTFLPLTTQELNRPEQYYNKTYGKE